jgi:hypothetical protein
VASHKIVCAECHVWWGNAVGKYPGEYIGIVKGVSTGNFICDSCGKDLKVGENVSAVTVAIHERALNHPWHIDFLLPIQGN